MRHAGIYHNRFLEIIKSLLEENETTDGLVMLLCLLGIPELDADLLNQIEQFQADTPLYSLVNKYYAEEEGRIQAYHHIIKLLITRDDWHQTIEQEVINVLC